MKKVLLTGFDPFGKDTINPALEVVKQLDGLVVDDIELIALEVPTVFQKSIKVVQEGIEKHTPDVVICVGQAGGRKQITPERVAINVDDARIPDNEGNQPIDEPIVEGGPAAYWTTLPIKKMVQQMRRVGVPATVSNTAGTFVCNHLFYGMMHYLHEQAPHVRGGFIHIPFIPEQILDKSAPSMSLDLIVKGIKIAAITAVKVKEDICEVGGALH
ncbi:pyroglutamyl-peptidase [Cerasibacillus quisquiliarum]|uniref:Pyrrolidone-carboxylate peptidase n=1 Tax=Cerasibacillus quisquiliarum TaxID=227865 RepID=A0A511UX97_9BACI|nr:pyroglutamyl-peptidase I [Cerasibacillus quisquiliarum]MBB5145015.1 pyroglutamyl-peptidase [Cerasibacillus quisquiliarum]GEN30093.1 pyrrolidone-carboxylate peptidase [Cerasibacillus quisquiliarum]